MPKIQFKDKGVHYMVLDHSGVKYSGYCAQEFSEATVKYVTAKVPKKIKKI